MKMGWVDKWAFLGRKSNISLASISSEYMKGSEKKNNTVLNIQIQQ
jgi:hypothetical protein